MNTSNSGSNVSDTFDGMMFGGINSTANYNMKDSSRFDDSSSGLIFASKQINAANSGSYPPKEGGIGKILTTLHLEWNKHEMEKCKWVAERAEYDAKIAILEGRLKSYANINNELLQRIKMLESALLVARSQEKFGEESIIPSNSSINDYQVPKSIYTREQSKRGRHLLQQYLKEIQIIDDTIRSKHTNDEKIAEYIMKTSPDILSAPYKPKPLQSGYDSTNYSKTFGYPDSKKQKSNNPMSMNESTKFLDDMKKGFRQTLNDRRKESTTNHAYKINEDINNDKSMELKHINPFNKDDTAVSIPIDSHGYDSTNHLLDILQSFSSFSPDVDENIDNNDLAMSTNPLLHATGNTTQSISPPQNIVNDSSINIQLPSGGVVRQKDRSSKKPSRMKLDMLNFEEDTFTGTSIIPKKSEEHPSIFNIFPKSATANTNPTLTDTKNDEAKNLNTAFESKLDILAKRFNVGSSDISGSSNDDLCSITSSNSIVTLPDDTGDEDDDLGILNNIESLIMSQDDSSNLLQSSINDDAGVSANVKKHWSINSVLRGHNDSISCVDLHPNDKIIASSSLDGIICLWQYNDKKKSDMFPTFFLRGHEYPVLYCLFNSIGDCLYSSDIHGNILVWNILNHNNILQKYSAHDEAIWHMSHNQHTNTLLSASADGVCCLWKPDSMEPISSFNIENSTGANQLGIISADFSPIDTSKIIVAAADTIYMFDVNSQKTIFQLKLDDNYTPTKSSSSGLIQSTSVHPSINIYATGWGHNQVKIADLTSGKFISNFIAHPAPITAITFGNNCSGTFLATGGANGSIHMWDSNYSCYQDVPPHRIKHHSGVNCLSFHSKYPHMVTGGADELVKLYI